MAAPRSGIPKFSNTTVSTTQQPKAAPAPPAPVEQKPRKKGIDFNLPPLSVVGKKKELDFEQIRKKVRRRDNPEGEDKKQLASILKHLKESKTKVRVQEFVNLVSKYTCDNGDTMRKVMEEDLATFRKMVTKIYENMTQDVSDVLVNEQIQTNDFYQEKCNLFEERILFMIGEILQMIPEFDFYRYVKDGQDYLNYACPLPQLVMKTAEDIEMQKRQEAFHRLQWLKIEEGRLAEENKRLDKRLDELKNEHNRESQEASMKTKIMERKMHDLEEQEQEKKEHLNELEDLLGKNIVRTEAYIRLEEDEAIRLTKPRPRDEPKKSASKRKPGFDWPAETAADIEGKSTKKAMEAEKSVVIEKKRLRRKEREMSHRIRSPDTDYPEPRTMQRVSERTVQKTTTTVQEKRPGYPKRCGGGCD